MFNSKTWQVGEYSQHLLSTLFHLISENTRFRKPEPDILFIFSIYPSIKYQIRIIYQTNDRQLFLIGVISEQMIR